MIRYDELRETRRNDWAFSNKIINKICKNDKNKRH